MKRRVWWGILAVMLVVVVGMLVTFTPRTAVYVIPEPQEVAVHKWKRPFRLEAGVSLIYDIADAGAANAARLVSEATLKLTGIELQGNDSSARRTITFSRDTAIKNPEGYRLEVSAKNVILYASSQAGFVYGAQTLTQLIPERPPYRIGAVSITDWPRFGWRGAMLDVSRHFFDKEYIFRFLDLLALHKMNVFHWHLTDNHGWRLEIKKYPLLTEIGAWRADRTGMHWRRRKPQ